VDSSESISLFFSIIPDELKKLIFAVSNLKKHSNLIWITASFILTLIVGVIRYLTGPELAFSIFYIFPVILVTWKVGKWAGIFIATTSAASWLVADLMMLNAFSNSIIPFVNETLRLIVFLAITWVTYELKISLESQKTLARTDPLTGIVNRRAFLEMANIELRRALRFRHPLTLIYIDLDNFKNVNDRFGHSTGDVLLRSVANLINQNIREVDIFGRMGGDEFCIFLSETEQASAHTIATKLQNKLLDLVRKNCWPATFSIGVVTYSKTPISVEEMIKEADRQMYSAKEKGKNKIQLLNSY
jgi:diguanylate cyclase (GGDEF)-like protein